MMTSPLLTVRIVTINAPAVKIHQIIVWFVRGIDNQHLLVPVLIPPTMISLQLIVNLVVIPAFYVLLLRDVLYVNTIESLTQVPLWIVSAINQV
jgi:hypothetical protein